MPQQPPPPLPNGDVALDSVVTVQLGHAQTDQRTFLRQLQAALRANASLGCLSPGPGKDVFVVPGAAEQMLKTKLGADDNALEALFHSWGALTVNRLAPEALISLMRSPTVPGAQPQPAAAVSPAPPKLAITSAPRARKVAAASPLPKDFRGPHDWNLGPRGANVVAAWEMFANEPAHAAQLPWKDLRIGHIDTGYTEHAALAWDAGQSTTVDVASGKDYWEDPPDGDPRDGWLGFFAGHGTRMSAAFAGFLSNAPGSPFYGVAPGVQVIPYRVTDSVIINHVVLRVTAAIKEAVEDGCHIINISLGSSRDIFEMSDALDLAYERGVIVCCAAGQVFPKVIYPGRYNRCVTMGGVGPDFKPWASAATGKYVDLCGPADMIRRVKAENRKPGDAAQEIYPKADGDGTSYATATCSGIAALWLAWHGADALKARYAPTGAWQIPAAFKKLLRATATPGAWPADATDYGSGVLNAAGLLGAALPVDGSLHKAKAAGAGFDPND